MQMFAAESHAPRTRRTLDAAIVVVGIALLWGLVLITDDRSTLEEEWVDLVEEIPNWVEWFANALYLSGWIYFLFLIIGLGLVARQRTDLLRDMLIALALPILGSLILAQIVNDEWPDLPLFAGEGEIADTFPALPITVLTAVHATAAPQLSRPLRRFGWIVILLASFASLVSNFLLIRDVMGALLMGSVVAALVHLMFGSPAGRPTINRIKTAASDIGVGVTELDYTAVQPPSFTVAEGSDDKGEPIRVTVLGRDAASDDWLNKAWRFAWYHESGSPFGAGRRQKVEHAALTQVLAERGHVNVPELRAVGVGGAGDALLISATAGVPLAAMAHVSVTDDLLDAIWSEVRGLHAAGLAHGQLNADHITLDGDSVVLVGFENGKVSVGEHDQLPDNAELIVSTALLVGQERALAAAQRGLGDDELGDTLSYLQTAALTPELRHEVRQEDLSLKDLRSRAAELAGVDDIELEQLHRVSIGKVVINVITVLAVYVVMSGLASIGFDEIWDALTGATWSLVLVALVLVQCTNVSQAVAVLGAAPKPLPLGITTTEQFAVNFINLAIPSTAARVAVNMRFYQRFGIGVTAASTAGLMTSLAGFAVQLFLLFLLIVIGDQSIDWDQFAFGGDVLKLILLAAAIALVALIVMFAVRRMRQWIMNKIREPLRTIRETLAKMMTPKKATQLFGGNLVEQILFALGLTICVFAVGGSVSLPEVIFINTMVSLFAGLLPIPGGIGVTEAGLTAGLVAVGVPQDTAVAAVLIYRLCTYYLPPIWGWYAMKWLTDRDYL